ncbi:hypothetical protein CRD60_03170 [Bifidobacterium aemilianum]|uniref:Antitoxin SocA-like Panacea domain-containing protein n=1 Tax=Bifidobacterium aemilianum TaxID=2493120 RepID=A0A366K9L6_9BIFI|nr:type II toxin-antitoxin system antitoxin SocA domain-containing protein [Bifidobacterium aemilianum]RBP98289.1 hypothetical protein CRD60_03170 [Bifidobacterium aemilianum]
MNSLDVANLLIDRYGSTTIMTNLMLNSLVYFAQVESLRNNHTPLFTDAIEAWEVGPVEPAVVQAFKGYGRRRVTRPRGCIPDDASLLPLLDGVMAKYGFMTAYDMVCFACRQGSAWLEAYQGGDGSVIAGDDIIRSRDGLDLPVHAGSLASAIGHVNYRWPNTFRILKNA